MGSNNLTVQIISLLIILITVKTNAADTCADKITNCRSYGSSACQSYKDWALANCAYTCSFCTGPPPAKPCVDNRNDCDQYVADICTKPSWRTWAEDNCSKFCGFCSVTNTTTVVMSSTPPTTTTVITTTQTGPAPCADGVNFCMVYSKRACTDMTWADKYCKKFCSRC